MYEFYEFFAGGGMARQGLGPDWRCTFANDFDSKKVEAYRANWGPMDVMHLGDIAQINSAELPGRADLAWASFPCQDLSLAGPGAGIRGTRSGTFFSFWNIIKELRNAGRCPRLIAMENVCGALTSHLGDDFRAIADAFTEASYRFGALVVDASLFVPQSRPRLFMIGVRNDVALDPRLLAPGAIAPFHPRRLTGAVLKLAPQQQNDFLWFNIPTPPLRNTSFSDLIEEVPQGVEWHTAQETERLLSLMSPLNLAKVDAARRAGRLMVGSIYKRTRPSPVGKVQRAEVRFDEVAGCLRTPAGGSSRLTIMVVDGDSLRSRLVSPRETARLMGLPDEYILPGRYNDAYHLTGDGVVAPVVSHIARHLLEPILVYDETHQRRAA